MVIEGQYVQDRNCVGRYHEWEQRRGCFGSCIPTTWNKLSEEEDNDLHQTIGLAAKQHRNLVLMGDFNYPNIQWGSRRTDKVGAKFLELIVTAIYISMLQSLRDTETYLI